MSLASTNDTKQKHIVITEAELLELPLSTYQCEVCGFNVKTKANLRAHHIKTHKILKHYQLVHMKRSFKCHRCDLLFSTPSSHAYHERLCGNTFACPVCDRKYSLKKHLNQHFRRTGHRNGMSKEKSMQQRVHTTPLGSIASDNSYSTESIEGVPATPVSITSNSPIPTPMMLPVFLLPVPLNGSNFQYIPVSTGAVTNMDPSLSIGGFPSTDKEQTTGGHLYPPGLFPTLNLGQSSLLWAMQAMNGFRGPVQQQQEHSSAGPAELGPMVSSCATCASRLTTTAIEKCTQTESTDPARDTWTEHVTPAPESASVNIGTDDDDISAFIGSLFCDASVETCFLTPKLVSECTDTGLDGLDQRNVEDTHMACTSEGVYDEGDEPTVSQSPPNAYTLNPLCPTETPKPITVTGFATSPLFPFQSSDESVQTGTAYAFENASMQTDTVGKSHAAASTHDYPFPWTERHRTGVLQTPPPVDSAGAANVPVTSGTFAPTHIPRLLSPIISFLSPLPPPSINPSESNNSHTLSFNYEHPGEDDPDNPNQSHLYTSPLTFDPTMSKSYYQTTSHSVGMQSSPWSPVRNSSSMETQTRSGDLGEWLSSVQTQTSATSPVFDRLCVLVGDGSGYTTVGTTNTCMPQQPL